MNRTLLSVILVTALTAMNCFAAETQRPAATAVSPKAPLPAASQALARPAPAPQRTFQLRLNGRTVFGTAPKSSPIMRADSRQAGIAPQKSQLEAQRSKQQPQMQTTRPAPFNANKGNVPAPKPIANVHRIAPKPIVNVHRIAPKPIVNVNRVVPKPIVNLNRVAPKPIGSVTGVAPNTRVHSQVTPTSSLPVRRPGPSVVGISKPHICLKCQKRRLTQARNATTPQTPK
jgi:hypothetical protein